MYIAYNINTKRVVVTSKKPFINVSVNVAIAETNEIPEKYDYLLVDNVRVETRVVQEAYTEEVIELNEETQQEETKLVEHPQVTETYCACDLIPKFNEYTAEQIEAQKQKKCDDLTERYVEKRYTVKQELAIQRQKETKPEEWQAYFDYVEECKAKAKLEVYGN